MGVVAAGVGDGELVCAGSCVKAAASAQQATTAPTLTKPRLLSATRSPQFESPDNRRTRALALRAFQSVGRRSQVPGTTASTRSKVAPDPNHPNRLVLAP